MNDFQRLWLLAALSASAVPSAAQRVLYERPLPTSAPLNALATCGDLDGDGVADFVAGFATASAGRGQVSVFSGVDGRLLRTVLGDAANDQLGRDLAVVGDLDADGVDDHVAIAPTRPGRSGHARAFSGASGAVLHTAAFDHDDELQPWVVARLGDLNGDGTPDYAVSLARQHNREGANLVIVVDGRGGREIGRVSDAIRESFYGARIVGLGDIDGDSVADFAVSAPNHDFGAGAHGAVFVYSGASLTRCYTLAGTAAERLGGAMAAVPDRDGDGVVDLALVATWRSGGETFGDVVIRSGRDGALRSRLRGDPRGFWASTARLDAGSDLDADGVTDLVVSGHARRGTTTDFAIAAYSGATERLLFVRRGSDLSSGVVAGGADLDRDGHDDLLVVLSTPTGPRLRVDAGAPAFLEVTVARAASVDQLDVWIRGRPTALSSLWLTEIDGLRIDPVLVAAPEFLCAPVGFRGSLPPGFRACLGFESVGRDPERGCFRTAIERVDCGR